MHETLKQFGDMGKIVDTTFTQVGIEPGKTIRPYGRPYSWSYQTDSFTGENSVGMLDYNIRVMSGRPDVSPYDTPDLDKNYLFGDLLISKSGRVKVTVPPESDWDFNLLQRVVDIEVFSSPHAINDVQSTLGRHPGEDAFKLVRGKGKTLFTAGEWVDGFAQLKVPVADLHDWELVSHDLAPFDHVQSWIVSPTSVCRSIADAAQQLQEKYGDRIHSTAGNTVPSKVNAFAQALDDLQDITRPIIDTITKHASDPELKNMYESAQREVIMDDVLHRSDRSTFGMLRRKRHSKILQTLELLPTGTSYPDNAKGFRNVIGRYITHTASILAIAEEISPTTDENIPAKYSKRDNLTSIAHAFAYAKRP